MAWLYGCLSLLVGFPTYLYVSHIHQAQLIADRQENIQALATSAATVIAENLIERRREIELLVKTPLYRNAPLDSAEFRASLERLQHSYPHYSWIGLADRGGVVRAATSDHLLGKDVQQRPWFMSAQGGTYVGDLHEAKLLAQILDADSNDQPLRFIDFAAPVFDSSGQLRGVLGAHAHWRWAGDVLAVVMPKRAQALGLDFFIVNKDNKIIYPDRKEVPAAVPDLGRLSAQPSTAFQTWADGQAYLTKGVSIRNLVDTNPLNWRVVVSQPQDVVLADVRGLQRVILLTFGIGGVVFLLLAWLGAERMSRPLEQLTDIAHRIEQGQESMSFETAAQSLELRKLSDALSGMAATLVQRKHELEASNRGLEAKVSERTAELSRLNLQLEKLARTDALTGLSNRLKTNERLREEFERMKRTGSVYSVLVLDIDHFKRINDTHGHAVGDRVLKQVSQVLSRTLRDVDFIGRVGGEEFMVILPATAQEPALVVAEKLRVAVQQTPMEPVGQMTVSVEVQEASNSDVDDDAVVKGADTWLYFAKNTGRNRVAPIAEPSPAA